MDDTCITLCRQNSIRYLNSTDIDACDTISFSLLVVFI